MMGQVTGHYAERMKKVITDMIEQVSIVYYDQAWQEIGRELIGPVKSGETTVYVIPKHPGWTGLKFSLKLQHADFVYQTKDGEDVIFLGVPAHRVTEGLQITMIAPRSEDMNVE